MVSRVGFFALVQPHQPGSGTFFRDLQKPPDVFIACYVRIRTAGRALCQERQVDLGRSQSVWFETIMSAPACRAMSLNRFADAM